MKIALIGASGRVGARLLAELLDRRHGAISIARHHGNGESIQLGAEGLRRHSACRLAPLLAVHGVVIERPPHVRSNITYTEEST